jgi:acyltransferase
MSCARSSGGRVVALDVARALGVGAMVFGHTCDALLSPAARSDPMVSAYWQARGLTAPLFMMVSGWAVAVVVSRSSARGLDVIRGRLPRVLLLLALGYTLRFPGWNLHGFLSGDRPTWQHFLAFDALHAIAVGLLVATIVLSLRLSQLAQGLVFAALGVLAVAWGTIGPALPLPDTLPALALAQAVGGTSPFPIFPWVAYFFFGAAASGLVRDVRARCAVGLASVGVYAAAAVYWEGFGDMSPAHPVLVMFRVGVVLLLLSAFAAVPSRAGAFFAPVARSSLGVYAIHVPVVYGWSTLEGLAQRVGPRLAFIQAALAAVVLLLCVLAAERVMRLAAARAVAAARLGIGQLRSSP